MIQWCKARKQILYSWSTLSTYINIFSIFKYRSILPLKVTHKPKKCGHHCTKRIITRLHLSIVYWPPTKHAILKTVEVYKRLSGALNYYITQCTGNSRSFWRQDVVEKANIQQKGPSGPPIEFWRSEELEKCCCRENSTQQRAGSLGLRLSNPGEQERYNADGHKSGGQYVAVLFGLQLPHTHNPFNKVRGIYF